MIAKDNEILSALRERYKGLVQFNNFNINRRFFNPFTSTTNIFVAWKGLE